MPPAARVGDMTAHGGVIVGPGAPTLMIGGLPAALLGDMHTCPMFTGPVPHVGGPITLASMTVTYMGRGLAYVGSICTCVGPPDSIIPPGAPTVMVRP
ncbi:MAG: PAAR domain-containing protein [Caldilineaceae bacterium]